MDNLFYILQLAIRTDRIHVSCIAAALSFSLYDVMLSFSDEVKYIWRSKLSPITAFYFFLRYYVPAALLAMVTMRSVPDLSVKMCGDYFKWIVAGGPSVFTLILDIIMFLRIFALYRHNLRVFAILLVLALGRYAAHQWACITLAVQLAKNVVILPHPIHICVANIPDPVFMKFMLWAYVPGFCLSIIFLSMTLWKLFENHQLLYGKFSLKVLHDLQSLSPLLVGFIRGGSIFFAISCFINLLAVLSLFINTGGTSIQTALYPSVDLSNISLFGCTSDLGPSNYSNKRRLESVME